ncbi:uncharacterized protein LOC128883679 isoform X2 [Hylaeus volcanicus]|uniref:uncharacterized protein LOC128883679 isoform X2 n=1 Tax=Hylaeus volcanicus TaxID=313075 RepID=UPI0023B7D378|nr:uncharacterized protein LOC128883679 isoform X2 [Hylaeus volcanicus]XP_053992273.1 uncharacterized protein LOC128883679 isoform X2 [Hylaeus volcanicus]
MLLLRQPKVDLDPCHRFPECMKILDKFISQCALNEGFLKPVISLREFCETSVSADPSFTDRDFKYCLELGKRLAKKTGANFAALHTNNHVMGSCSAFLNMCHEHGGGWRCYSGLCDELAACTDCPYVMLQLAPQQPLQPEICADRGECFIGSTTSNNGYCECDNPFRGLACDQYVIHSTTDI